MKDLKNPSRPINLSFCRRQRDSVNDVAYAILAGIIFIVLTATLGIGVSLGFAAIFLSGCMVKRHLDKRRGRS